MTSPHNCLDTVHPADVERLGLGAAAQLYQGMGYAVLGLAVGDKKPHELFEHGVDWATQDPRVIPWMWSSHKLAGVGVATGSRSQLIVIDLDVKHGIDGIAEFTRWWLGDDWGSRAFVMGQAFPGAPVAVTPSDGRHIWLRLPQVQAPDGSMWPYPSIIPTRKGILPGVDIKAEGGYVVAAPTQIWVHPLEGGRVLLPYRWAHGCPCSVPEAPPWLLQWAMTAPGGYGGGSGGDGNYDPLPELEELKISGLAPGSRNVTLHRLACSLFRRYGTTPSGVQAAREEIEQVLAATSREGGFGRGEIERALTSALRFVQGCERTEEEGFRDYVGSRQRWGAIS